MCASKRWPTCHVPVSEGTCLPACQAIRSQRQASQPSPRSRRAWSASSLESRFDRIPSRHAPIAKRRRCGTPNTASAWKSSPPQSSYASSARTCPCRRTARITAVSSRSSLVAGLSGACASLFGVAHSSHRSRSFGVMKRWSAPTHTVRVQPAFEHVMPAFLPGSGWAFGIASTFTSTRSAARANASIHGTAFGCVSARFVSTRSRCSDALNRRARSPHVRGCADRLPTSEP